MNDHNVVGAYTRCVQLFHSASRDHIVRGRLLCNKIGDRVSSSDFVALCRDGTFERGAVQKCNIRGHHKHSKPTLKIAYTSLGHSDDEGPVEALPQIVGRTNPLVIPIICVVVCPP